MVRLTMAVRSSLVVMSSLALMMAMAGLATPAMAAPPLHGLGSPAAEVATVGRRRETCWRTNRTTKQRFRIC